MNRLFCHVTCFSKSVRQLNIHRLNVKKKIKKNKNRKLSTNNLFNINNDDNSSNKTNPSTNKTWHLPMGVKSINWKQNRLFYTEFATFSTKLFKVCIVVFFTQTGVSDKLLFNTALGFNVRKSPRTRSQYALFLDFLDWEYTGNWNKASSSSHILVHMRGCAQILRLLFEKRMATRFYF